MQRRRIRRNDAVRERKQEKERINTYLEKRRITEEIVKKKEGRYMLVFQWLKSRRNDDAVKTNETKLRKYCQWDAGKGTNRKQ